MKLDELVNFVEKFILDIIGVILPGVILLFGLAATLNPKFLDQQWFWVQLTTTGKWVVLVCVAYVSGHALHFLGENIVAPILGYLPWLGVRNAKEAIEDLQNSSRLTSFTQLFEEMYTGVLPKKQGKVEFNVARSFAMSVAPEMEPLTYKFMFISLMNLGVATAVFVTGLVFIVAHFPTVLDLSLLKFVLTAFSLLVLIPALFLRKYSEFFNRAMTVPFPSATVSLLRKNEDAEKVMAPSNSAKANPLSFRKNLKGPVVYLAGGFVSGWQDSAMAECPAASYLDPRTHGLAEPLDYTAWDLDAIRKCDIVFAVLEATNPGGFALALEVGYAKSRGKYVVLVDEKSSFDPSLRGYLQMLRAVADEVYDSFDDGVIALARIVTLLNVR